MHYFHRHSIDYFGRPGNSPLHRAGPRVKVVGTLLFILAVTLVPHGFWPLADGIEISSVHLALLCLLLLMIGVANAPGMEFLRRVGGFALMLSCLAISIPLSHGLASGWWLMITVMTKGLLCFTAMLLLAHTTPFEQILTALGRLGVPRLFVATLAAMYRFLFVFQEERTRMQRARMSRMFTRGDWLRHLRCKASLVGMLLVRSSERAERVHAAMLARGFNGRTPTLDGDVTQK